MSTRSQRMSDKAQNERHSRILKALMQLPENKICAECDRKDPRWASHSLGVFVCLRCSGIHRSLGTHISRMKSVDLDTWTPEQIQNMMDWGNARANWYWFAKKDFAVNEGNIEFLVRCKYERRQFARFPDTPDPKTIPVGTILDTELLQTLQQQPQISPSSSISASLHSISSSNNNNMFTHNTLDTTNISTSTSSKNTPIVSPTSAMFNGTFASFPDPVAQAPQKTASPFADIMSLYNKISPSTSSSFASANLASTVVPAQTCLPNPGTSSLGPLQQAVLPRKPSDAPFSNLPQLSSLDTHSNIHAPAWGTSNPASSPPIPPAPSTGFTSFNTVAAGFAVHDPWACEPRVDTSKKFSNTQTNKSASSDSQDAYNQPW